MGIVLALGQFLAKMLAKLGLRRLISAKLTISSLDSHVRSFVLPEGYESEAYFPKRYDAGTSLPEGLRAFEGRVFHVRNKGWENHAEQCEVIAFLTTSAGMIPIITYWMDEGARELTNIPPREDRPFIPFLVNIEKGVLLFCSSYFPSYRSIPTWQYELPLRTPLELTFQIRSTSAKSVSKAFILIARGDRTTDICVEANRSIRTPHDNA